jgi:hypothetical protein
MFEPPDCAGPQLRPNDCVHQRGAVVGARHAFPGARIAVPPRPTIAPGVSALRARMLALASRHSLPDPWRFLPSGQ